MKVHLIRHGTTEWNRLRRWQGTKDIPLNERGRQDALTTAYYMKKNFPMIENIYSSDLRRALETAELIGKKYEIIPTQNHELRECSVELWSGFTVQEVLEKFPKEFSSWRENPYSSVPLTESLSQVQRRAVKAFNNITSKEQSESQIVIVSHGLWIRALICWILGIPLQNNRNFSVFNCSITSLSSMENGIWCLEALNFNHHLNYEVVNTGEVI